jgi:KDO2-lipid IV(A) lauroyltransferase
MAWSPSITGYKAGAAVARVLPEPLLDGLVDTVARGVVHATPERRLIVERNLRRVHGPGFGGAELRRAVRKSFQSYGRYWAQSFRLPGMSDEEIDAGHTHEGYEHIVRAREEGHGPLMVIPHLGGWEWAAFWLTRIQHLGVTAIVEALEPPELFEWFVAFRRSLGMNVVPLGGDAAAQVAAAVKRLDVVCLLADRDISGTGADVEFFGERTTLPSGPALLAFRTGAPVIPVAVYFRRHGIHTVVKPPLIVERQGRLRDDVQRVTQDIAAALEELIRVAPEQWHLMEPNWPSDRQALEALSPRRRTAPD